MTWQKALTAVAGVLFAVAAAIVNMKAGPHWLQTTAEITMTALGALGLGITRPLVDGQRVAPVVELKPVDGGKS